MNGGRALALPLEYLWPAVTDPDRSASSRVIAHQNPNPHMKPKRSKTSVLALAVALLIPVATEAASKVTFDNQSGKQALVKLVGPTTSAIPVENSKKESVSVAPGHYFIKIRYGAPGAYSYSKGDEFDVTETATATSDITITLHKVVAGNYRSKAISEAEFGGNAPAGKPASPASSGDQQRSHNISELGVSDQLSKVLDKTGSSELSSYLKEKKAEILEWEKKARQSNKAESLTIVWQGSVLELHGVRVRPDDLLGALGKADQITKTKDVLGSDQPLRPDDVVYWYGRSGFGFVEFPGNYPRLWKLFCRPTEAEKQ